MTTKDFIQITMYVHTCVVLTILQVNLSGIEMFLCPPYYCTSLLTHARPFPFSSSYCSRQTKLLLYWPFIYCS